MSDGSAWMTYKERNNSSEALAVQSRGRVLSEAEQTFANALEAIFARKIHDFDAVSSELTTDGITAPASGRTDWAGALLADELNAVNKSLDEAYAGNGYGA